MNKLEFAQEMQTRTKVFAVKIIRFFAKLPKAEEARVIGRQLLRSGTSVAANYRAACRAKSAADFISKMGTVVEETNEVAFWLDLLEESDICRSTEVESLKQEADALLRLFSTSLATAKRNQNNH